MRRYLQGIIFDLDGVLTDTAEYHYQAWKRLADRLGIHFDRELNEHLKGVSRMDSLEFILARGEKTYTQEEKERLAAEKNEDYVALIQEITPDDLLLGARELLEFLKLKGYKIGLASASKNAQMVVDKLGITDYFNCIADARKISKSKPDPEIFLTVAKYLNLDPRACLGVEDAQAGVQAIKSAGMFAVGVGDPEVLCEVDVVISDLQGFVLDKYQEMVEKLILKGDEGCA